MPRIGNIGASTGILDLDNILKQGPTWLFNAMWGFTDQGWQLLDTEGPVACQSPGLGLPAPFQGETKQATAIPTLVQTYAWDLLSGQWGLAEISCAPLQTPLGVIDPCAFLR
jgi:hypothetical protein